MKNTLYSTVPLSAKIILYFHIEHCTHTKRLTIANILLSLKVKTSIGNAPISKNEMEALITNHVKEYVLTKT